MKKIDSKKLGDALGMIWWTIETPARIEARLHHDFQLTDKYSKVGEEVVRTAIDEPIIIYTANHEAEILIENTAEDVTFYRVDRKAGFFRFCTAKAWKDYNNTAEAVADIVGYCFLYLGYKRD